MKKIDSLDYGLAMKNLLKQTFSFQRYKEINIIFAVILGILLAPLFIPLGVLVLSFIIFYTFFKIIASPIEYLTSILHREGSDVKHATQFIIYFIGFPIVFFGYVLTALLSTVLFVVFLLTSVICSLVSLGGCNFAPFINDQPERQTLPPMANPIFNEVFDTIWLFTLTLVGIILEIVNAILYQQWREFASPFTCFLICYIIGVSLMGFEKLKNSHTTTTSDDSDEEVYAEEVEISDELEDDFDSYEEM